MRLLIIALLGLAIAPLPLVTAWASSAGVATDGCGCHGSGSVGIDLSINPAMISPGQTATVTVTISSPTAAEAGLFLQSNAGTYATIAGQGLAEVTAGLTHTSPKSLFGDEAQFSFQWTAPGGPGAVRFEVWGVAANGNNSTSGDAFDDGVFDFVYGCAPQTFYRDFDGDGYGRSEFALVHCMGAAPRDYAAEPGDCDDNRASTYPGAPEYCNQIDDDCDDEIDEDALPVDLYPDADGDGYYGVAEFASGEMMMGCVPTEGWAAEPGDCSAEDPLINPAAEEICNGFDDDCDFDVDERVRPQCGEGWCRRESVNCDPDNCAPGEPREEICNFFDDDCDGLLDEDVPCPEGESCQAGECRAVEPEGLDESGGGVSGGSGGSGSGTSGGSGQDGMGGGCGCRSQGRDHGGLAALLLLLLTACRRSRGRR